MKKISLFFSLLFSIFAFSQIHFEKAYFINNDDLRMECLIKNVDWRNNPTSFEYKIEEGSAVKIGDIKNVKFFEIYNEAKYLRATLNIDQSSDNLNKLSSRYEPEFLEKKVFLKELVEGDVKLYKYDDGGFAKYFLKEGDKQPEQLIYKPYLIEVSKMAYNRDYQKQLQKVLTCPKIPANDLKNAEYREKDLVKLVSANNQCQNPNYENKIVQQKKGFLNLSVRPRVNFASMTFSNFALGKQFNMESKTGFGIGVEMEYVFPFNRNKWSVIFEPTYQYYKAQQTNNDDPSFPYKASVDYSSIELPLGIRHYFFLNDDSKLVINGQYIFDLKIKNNFEFRDSTGTLGNSLDGKSNQNFAFGIGYQFKNKYGVEVKYFTERNILENYTYWSTKFQNVSLILSYNLFSK
ncbi:tRNA modification GTPase [Kaistella sp. G5-32]|uniref:tRNA modification GTPase n=1 Tax=Kaistella gelatinilytica TaxID=2787636 RepID=A0ABS0F7G3_9FLAO|nr:tRNA modification GTPase [Kaistella gelatinilytica]MBF8455612.1 tRNA modification GTPase [Kaistella gelatinilytica]